MNLQTYVETQFATFDELPFNELDAAVFTQLAMVRVELAATAYSLADLREDGLLVSGAQGGHPCLTLRDLLCAEHLEVLPTGLAADNVRQCLIAAAMSPRYRSVTITGYQTVLDPIREVQFSATTFSCPQFTFVGLRGTDASLTGWHEDFNLSFMNPIPGQQLALDYVCNCLAQNPAKPLYVGGHSKGGNLAEYVLLVNPQLSHEVEAFYSFDGPGFKKDAFTSQQFAAAAPHFRKLVPQDSIIGMILDSESAFSVVESVELGFMQHDLFSWEVEGDAFVRREGLTPASQTIDIATRDWIHSYTDEELSSFVNALFQAAYSSGAFDLTTLFGGGAQSVLYLQSAASSVDDRQAQVLRRFASELADALGSTVKEQANDALKSARDQVIDQVEAARDQVIDQVESARDQMLDRVEGKLREARQRIASRGERLP